MPKNEFGCLPTIIGSMPHTDAKEACALITQYLWDIPAWPQLPRRTLLENMNAQYSEGFPGSVIEDNKITVDRSCNIEASMEKLYLAYLEDDFDKYPVSTEYATGLHEFLTLDNLSPRAVKGQMVGPVTWGLSVTDSSGRGIIYDDFVGDAVTKFLKLKAGWQERKLRELCKNTIIFLDEPYMSAFGSIGMMLTREQIISLLNEVFSGISGTKGVHCCGNTDWSILLETSPDIISFDAYNYAESLSLYPAEVKKFIDNGGSIAWGIVPSDALAISKETASSLQDRLEEAIAPFTRNGLRFKQLIARGLLTPSCGLGTMTDTEPAARALELLTELSQRIRSRYI
ncbi:methionine synthase [Chloroflexota bacterium]